MDRQSLIAEIENMKPQFEFGGNYDKDQAKQPTDKDHKPVQISEDPYEPDYPPLRNDERDNERMRRDKLSEKEMKVKSPVTKSEVKRRIDQEVVKFLELEKIKMEKKQKQQVAENRRKQYKVDYLKVVSKAKQLRDILRETGAEQVGWFVSQGGVQHEVSFEELLQHFYYVIYSEEVSQGIYSVVKYFTGSNTVKVLFQDRKNTKLFYRAGVSFLIIYGQRKWKCVTQEYFVEFIWDWNESSESRGRSSRDEYLKRSDFFSSQKLASQPKKGYLDHVPIVKPPRVNLDYRRNSSYAKEFNESEYSSNYQTYSRNGYEYQESWGRYGRQSDNKPYKYYTKDGVIRMKQAPYSRQSNRYQRRSSRCRRCACRRCRNWRLVI